MILEDLGELSGGLIIFFFGLSIAQYVLKFINKRFGKTLRKAPKLYKYYIWLMKQTIKFHKLFGILTIVAILTHFAIQFSYRGLSVTGVIAAGFMILQAVLGSFGFFTKTKSKVWLYTHRILSVVILIAILIHI